MSKHTKKIHWVETQDGDHWGRLMPMFCIWINGKTKLPYTLTFYEQPQDKKGNPKPRHVEVKSVHQGKCLAVKYLEMIKGE